MLALLTVLLASTASFPRGVAYEVAVIGSLEEVRPGKPPAPQEHPCAEISAARNERESFQIAVTAVDADLRDCRVRAGDLQFISGSRGTARQAISAEHIELRLVGYLEVTESSWRGDKITGPRADPLLDMRLFDCPRGEARSVWVTVYVPRGAAAGDYEGLIRLEPADAPARQVPLRLHVWDFTLPDENHLRTSFWFNSEQVTWVYQRKPTDFAFWRKWWDCWGEHRLATDVWLAWTALQFYREPDGTFSVDISALQQAITYVIEECHFNTVNIGRGCWGLSPFAHAPQVIDRASGQVIPFEDEAEAPPLGSGRGGPAGDPEPAEGPLSAQDAQKLYLNTMCDWLQERGWLEQAYLQIWDEPMRDTWDWGLKVAYPEVRAQEPRLALACVVGVIPELQGLFDIWCPHTHFYDRETYRLAREGKSLYGQKSFPAQVSASSTGGWGNLAFYTYRPTDAYDGSPYTYWAAAEEPTGEQPQWLQVDLDSPAVINGIALMTKEGRAPVKWMLLSSTDGQSFSPLQLAPDPDEPWTFRFEPTEVSHLRLEFYAAEAAPLEAPEAPGVALREVELLAEGMPREDTLSPEETRPVEMWEYNVGADWPSFCVDAPWLERRILPWQCWHRNIAGFLYYGMTLWPIDGGWSIEEARRLAQEQPLVWPGDGGGNGGAFALYPGPDGPIPSVRFALWREGMEDYEYLHLARQVAEDGGPLARRAARLTDLSGSWPRLSASAEELLAHRERLARLLERAERQKEKERYLMLALRRRVEDPPGSGNWRVVQENRKLSASQTAIVICDVWDNHWCRNAAKRCGKLAVKINELVEAARAAGVHIIHAPSNCMDFYDGTPYRQRMIEAPYSEPPPGKEVVEGPWPIAAPPDEGCDDETYEVYKAWSRQHPAITITGDDGISDSGTEVYNYFCQHGIEHMLIMGVHTNMCVLGRSFGIKQMVKWGVDVVLVRDLTDAMYDPRTPPYVSHDEGTQLVIEWIEKYWCPTVESEEVLRGVRRPPHRA